MHGRRAQGRAPWLVALLCLGLALVVQPLPLQRAGAARLHGGGDSTAVRALPAGLVLRGGVVRALPPLASPPPVVLPRLPSLPLPLLALREAPSSSPASDPKAAVRGCHGARAPPASVVL